MSRKSSRPESMGNPGSIANAMYDAQRREINGSMAFSGSFIAAGVIAVALGIFKYFSTRQSSESYDSMAWLIIAAVGILVGIIGFISIVKSLVSLGQIGKWAKEAESHASPFQGQKLNRKVAAMNQAQAMNHPDMQGMAEEPNERKKRGFFKRGRETKKKNTDDLYYKYNPQEKRTSPPKAAPMMEQKFDYGINEEKKLTFADEFLLKNKRDPFAQYRKDLGIKEEVKKEVEQKPQFIRSAKAVESAPSVQSVSGGFGGSDQQSSPGTVLDLSGNTDQESGKEVSFGLELSYFAEQDNEKNKESVKENVTSSDRTSEVSPPLEKAAVSEAPQKQESIISPQEVRSEEKSAQNNAYADEALNYMESHSEVENSGFLSDETISNEYDESFANNGDIIDFDNERDDDSSSGIVITYGDHNAEDDDIFFSAKTTPPPVSQNVPVQIQTQTQTQGAVRPRDEAPISRRSDASKENSKHQSAFSNFNKTPPPTVGLDFDYDEETKNDSTAEDKPNPYFNESTTTSPASEVKPQSAFSNLNKTSPPTVGLDLDYDKNANSGSSAEDKPNLYFNESTTTSPLSESKPQSAFSNFNKTSPPTVGLDLDYDKNAKNEPSANVDTAYDSKAAAASSNDDVKPKSAFSNFNKTSPSTVGLDIDYKKEKKRETEYDFSLFEDMGTKTPSSKVSAKPSPKTAVPPQPKAAVNSEKPANLSTAAVNNEARRTGSMPQNPEYDLDNFKKKESRPAPEQKKKQDKQEKKMSFSEKYLNKDKNKKQEAESKIVKNGTRAQRKFVDASEFDEWTCQSCGKVNQEYVGVCACGSRKPRVKKQH